MAINNVIKWDKECCCIFALTHDVCLNYKEKSDWFLSGCIVYIYNDDFCSCLKDIILNFVTLVTKSRNVATQ